MDTLPRREKMTTASHHHRINYIEFTTNDIEQTKAFYSGVFGWSFQDWGPEYIAFSSKDADISGGFCLGETVKNSGGVPLVVLYSKDLAATEADVLAAGGSIVTPTFEFPGGRRFHFSDGTGNVLGVWSE